MPSKGLSIHYWYEANPVLLSSLASLTPGMTAHDVAELLDEMDYEITSELTENGECMDLSDDALIHMYLNQVVLP